MFNVCRSLLLLVGLLLAPSLGLLPQNVPDDIRRARIAFNEQAAAMGIEHYSVSLGLPCSPQGTGFGAAPRALRPDGQSLWLLPRGMGGSLGPNGASMQAARRQHDMAGMLCSPLHRTGGH